MTLLLGTPLPAGAQSAPPSGDDAVSLQAGYEWHRDRFSYSFDNPSSINTPFLVPHTYTQRYWADNHWVAAAVRYELLGSRSESSIGVTAPTTSRASDIDVFYNPDNDVVTSGTDGDARMRGWRLAHWVEGKVQGVSLRLAYRYRRDVANFLPADIVVTHSRPPSTARRLTTDREFTTSQLHEFSVETGRRLASAGRWQLTGALRGSPLIVARLTTRLPDKYPDPIVAHARSFAVGARVEIERQGRWPLRIGIGWEKGTGYQASRSFSRDALELSVGTFWRRDRQSPHKP